MVDKMEKTTLTLIEKLSNANGVSGFEEEVRAICATELKEFQDQTVDHIGNLIVRSKLTRKPVVMLDAHLDEVGFIVQAINPQGMLKFLNLGSWQASNVGASKVRIRNAEGKYIKGIVASRPPHFVSDQERHQPLSIDNMLIDVGSSTYQETVENLKIKIASPIVPDVKFEVKENGLLLGKAFDCRIGVACLIETFKESLKKDLDVDLVACFSTQEEVGLRGVRVAVQDIEPDVAIVFEGCPADDTFTESYLVQSALGKGPMLRHVDVSMITNPRFQKLALDIAEKYQIPVQEAVRKGGGTNGAAINAFKKGVPVIVIGIPVRYAHTHYGYVDPSDYLAAKELAIKIIEELNPKNIERL